MNLANYKENPEEKKAVSKKFLGRRFVFHKDNEAQEYTIYNIQEWLKNKISVLEWLSQSQDPNLKEDLWLNFKRLFTHIKPSYIPTLQL